MSYYGCKKLVSVRVDEDLLNRVKNKLEEENKGKWYNKKTFTDLVETAMSNYVSEKKKA